MKTTSLTYPTNHSVVCPANNIIDTAPLAARYAVLTQAVLTYLAAGQFGRMVRASQTVLRLVRVFTRIEAQNVLLGRKRAMLSDVPWRDRVLSDLGGTQKLEAWDAAHQRSLTRIETKSVSHFSGYADVTQPWLYTAQRLAESERLKAHARNCMRASANPRIVRDRVKMDFDGLFRLAPVPRAKGAARRIKIFTQNSIIDYVWNPVPFAKVDGFGPASVWPAEFYAAMGIERSLTTSLHSPRACVSPETLDTGPISQACPHTPELEMGLVSSVCKQTHERDEGKRELDVIPLHQALPQKTWRALFENPLFENPG